MATNPGHYVAAVIGDGGDAAPAPQAAAAKAKRRLKLKLLRPDDTLVLGGVYRLVSFEEVLLEFVSKRQATPRRVVLAAADDTHQSDTDGLPAKVRAPPVPSSGQEATSDLAAGDHHPSDPEPNLGTTAMMIELGGQIGLARPGQWRPALPSIAEGSVVC
ncbi:hypothetical protein U9M48_008768 [Paspalum notatum var. saurae]|uniref:Uncharacterized protein n=1 Tax=Paspalum notatum var. saurae TaxID=547442 RepID=A0AAQ3WDW4_PASNO